ncbi:unconventional prefoldin RPB5 interactor isoform X1 [Ptiloglossa arizonensis]|uniref:unconventional prefoldin RPB5 interactor isoform X1 n=1 Tax=Ptiloglossa arizonensis TaxID=3350558 RepID=UPI003FA18FFB
MSNEDETQNLRRALLEKVFVKEIQQNEEQFKIWTAYKKGHQKVAVALNTFQKDLYVNCMVPIGKRALMKGKLIHTNEVLVCLGDGYFAKYSASGARALCERRIQHADEMLEYLNTERDICETRMMLLETDFLNDCADREIVEYWDESQIEEWRMKHREREREYNQKLAKFKKEERKKIETEEDLFYRLDQLEIEEELADEFNRLEDEQYELFEDELEEERESHDESRSSSESEKEYSEKEKFISSSEKKQSKEDVGNCKLKKSVSFIEQKDLVNNERSENLMKGRELDEDAEGSETNILRIQFSHSQNNPIVRSNDDSIKSPADIYRIFSKPKSILRRSPNDVAPVQITSPNYSTEEKEEEEESIKPSAYETVVKDIKERDLTVLTNTASSTDKETRPVSRFKRERQLTKKRKVRQVTTLQ